MRAFIRVSAVIDTDEDIYSKTAHVAYTGAVQQSKEAEEVVERLRRHIELFLTSEGFGKYGEK